MTVGSLFTGIGGFDLGLERAGMRVLWQCEQDDWCRQVLARHWPGVPCHPDVRDLMADPGGERRQRRSSEFGAGGASALGGEAGDLAGDPCGARMPVSVPYVDILSGGFPCQDLSYAGKGAGLAGERSGLWSEFARLVRELRPRYVIVENVPALRSRGLGVVLGDLAACGYDAEWDCLPAGAFGAPHRRDRIWIVAYPDAEVAGASQLVADPDDAGRVQQRRSGPSAAQQPSVEYGGDSLAYANECRRDGGAGNVTEADGRSQPENGDWWELEPDVGRVAHGIPRRVDRLRGLGNALVPQIAEWIGHRIMEFERSCS
jgi:DNA (cytosine-5)-methyltransferase 1